MIKAAALLFLLAPLAHAQQRPAITGIAFVRMYAADPAASTAFYNGKLGFDETKKDGGIHYVVNDSQWLEVTPLPTPAPKSRIAAIAFTTRNAAALQSYLKAHAVTIDQPLRKGSFAVHDPEGQLVIFVQQRPASSKAISPRARPAASSTPASGFTTAPPKTTSGATSSASVRSGSAASATARSTTSAARFPTAPTGSSTCSTASEDPSPRSLGSMNHFSLGVARMSDAVQALARNGCSGPECSNTQMGRDGKVQLNLFDPDLTRAEFMEFKPSGTTCCSPFTGPPPSEVENR